MVEAILFLNPSDFHPDSCRVYFLFTRAKVSSLTIAAAAFRVKGFMRFVYHRRQLREEIRRQYSRFFDGRSKRHFYSFHRTGEVATRCSLDSYCMLSRACLSTNKPRSMVCFFRYIKSSRTRAVSALFAHLRFFRQSFQGGMLHIAKLISRSVLSPPRDKHSPLDPNQSLHLLNWRER